MDVKPLKCEVTLATPGHIEEEEEIRRVIEGLVTP